jgi:hypothetical protein
MPDRRLPTGFPVSLDASHRPLSVPARRAGSRSAPSQPEEEPDRDLPSVHPLRARPAMASGSSAELPPEPAIPDLLPSSHVEQIFARSARTLHRWERRGHLTPVRVGHAKFYRAADVRRLVSGQLEATIGTPTDAPTGPGQPAPTGKSGEHKMP